MSQNVTLLERVKKNRTIYLISFLNLLGYKSDDPNSPTKAIDAAIAGLETEYDADDGYRALGLVINCLRSKYVHLANLNPMILYELKRKMNEFGIKKLVTPDGFYEFLETYSNNTSFATLKKSSDIDNLETIKFKAEFDVKNFFTDMSIIEMFPKKCKQYMQYKRNLLDEIKGTKGFENSGFKFDPTSIELGMKGKITKFDGWQLYQQGVKDIVKFLLQANYDLLSEEQKSKLGNSGLQNFSEYDENGVKGKLDEIIKSKNISDAVKVENDFLKSEYQNVIKNIDFIFNKSLPEGKTLDNLYRELELECMKNELDRKINPQTFCSAQQLWNQLQSEMKKTSKDPLNSSSTVDISSIGAQLISLFESDEVYSEFCNYMSKKYDLDIKTGQTDMMSNDIAIPKEQKLLKIGLYKLRKRLSTFVDHFDKQPQDLTK